MYPWGWVALAFSATYLTMIGYTWMLARRLRTARRRLEELQ